MNETWSGRVLLMLIFKKLFQNFFKVEHQKFIIPSTVLVKKKIMKNIRLTFK